MMRAAAAASSHFTVSLRLAAWTSNATPGLSVDIDQSAVCEPKTIRLAHITLPGGCLTIENLATAGGGELAAERPAPFRYGAVFLLTVALVVFVIAAPSANWSRAVALAIQGVALVVAIATGRQRKEPTAGRWA